MEFRENMLIVKQIAEALNVHESTIYKLIKRDKTFPIVRIRGCWYMRESALWAWIEAQEAARKASA